MLNKAILHMNTHKHTYTDTGTSENTEAEPQYALLSLPLLRGWPFGLHQGGRGAKSTERD